MTPANLYTNLSSAQAKAQIQDLMNRLNNPNLTQEQYKQIRYEFIKSNERSDKIAYPDTSGHITIGIGFNMDAETARTQWNSVFGNSISFDDAYNKRIQLTNPQIDQLFDYSITYRENQLFGSGKPYSGIVNYLTPSQKLAIEDMNFNVPTIVSRGTKFFENLKFFTQTGNQDYFNEALKEVLEGSNVETINGKPVLNIGLSNRRLKEAAILSGNADIKLPDSEVRQLINANKNKFDVKIDGKSANEYLNKQLKDNGFDTSLNFDESKFFTFESDEADPRIMLADSGMIRSDGLSPLEEAVIKLKDSEGKEFSIVKDVWLPLKDGTIATVNTVLNSIDSASQTLQTFITKDVAQFTNSYQDYLTKYQGQIMGDLIARIILGESLEEAMIAVAEVWAVNALLGNEIADKALKDLIKHYGVEANLVNGVSAGITFFISTVLIAQLRGDGMNGEQYTETAIKAAAVGAMQHFFPDTSVGMVIAIMDGAIKGFEDREDLDSQEWQDLGTSTAAAVGSAVAGSLAAGAIIGSKFGATLGTIVPGLGTVVGMVVGAIAGAILYMPLKNLLDNVSDATEELYDAIEDVIIKIDWSKGNLEENVKQAVAAIEDIAKAYTIDFPKDLATSIYNLFGGNYGKKLEAGEYWDPYSYLKITPKLDANGNPTADQIIIGIEPEGVVAIAREYYHDDIYGNSGSDNLIGKSGTNTIMGYEGNDHIEGRGDIDLLIGGKGDDEIFGGNGNDQIYGSEGTDNLFGGNGDDMIIGDTGTTLTPAQLAEITNNQNNQNFTIYNDFIQGGNGNDQIMGEYGDDTIQGNTGDDIILGGEGNDRIEGGEGDDSILGEEGDDTILAGEGNDIIDGGTGIDIIYGNAGNDNIRGGDDNDEIYGNEGVDIIYGDSGNDLINAGADNDLVFGGISNDIIYGADGDDTLSGEIGNDYLIGAEGTDTIDGGANDDVILGGSGNDTITTGEGNDTIIFRIGDGDDIIQEAVGSGQVAGNDILRLSGINSKLSDNTTNKIQLTKTGADLVIQFKDDTGSIIANNSITIKDQFTGSTPNGTGAEILKKIEFTDGYHIDLTSLTTVPTTDGNIPLTTYNLLLTTNIDTSIQEELILGYSDQMQIIEDQTNPTSTYNTSNYNTAGEQDQEDIDNERYNEVQWRSYKKKRSIFGGYYEVWYKYYEQNLAGTAGNDRIVGHWWSENIYGGDGDDQLNGGEGNDNLYGGTGDDILHGGAGNDSIYGQEGDDLAYGGTGNDYIEGGSDNDAIYGNAGDDNINGDKTSDIIFTSTSRSWKFSNAFTKKRLLITQSQTDIGLAGDDYIEGGDGNDTITDLSGHNIIIGGNGSDAINTGDGEDYIEGNDGNDVINAGNGNNLAYGFFRKKNANSVFRKNDHLATPNGRARVVFKCEARRKAAKRFEANSVYFLNLKAQKKVFANDNFKNKIRLKSF